MVEANLGTSVIPQVSDSHCTVVSFILPHESRTEGPNRRKHTYPVGSWDQPAGPNGSCSLESCFFFPSNIEELFPFYQDSWEQTVSFTAIATSKKKFAFYWQTHLEEGRCSGSIGRNLCVCGRLLHLSSDAFQVCFSLDDHEYFIQLKTG